jgi:arylsulfatase A-like enzyme
LIPEGLAANRSDESERPNIIWIMADDLGYGDLGCYGGSKIQTPNIDRLATEGMRFTQCYAGSTVCAPTRCVLMTGRHTGHSTVRGNSARLPDRSRLLVPLRPEDVTVAEVLKQAGYATGVTGKWGIGERGSTGVPNAQGFDQWLGFLNQKHAHGFYPEFLWKNRSIQIMDGNRGGHQRQWVHDAFNQFSLDFIDQHRDEPFFLYVAYTIPHGRYEIPSDAPYSNRDWPQSIKNYAAMVTRMDADVGRIMQRLKIFEIDKRTIVFFTSDNGAEVYYFRRSGELEQYESILNSSHPLRGYKRDLTDGGIRVPMIVRWPGQIEPGTKNDFMWAFWDFLPTAADLAGVDTPAEVDGQSVLPTLLGKRQDPHKFLYWEFFERGFQQAVRHKQWKALRLQQNSPLELYDVVNDLAEKNDVAAQHPDVIARIEAYLNTARSVSPYWPPAK